jgi:hypothetical protein
MSARAGRLSFGERIGGVLVAPRATLLRLAAGEARAGDVAWLMCGWLVAGWMPLLVRAVLTGAEAGVDAGLFGLLQTFQQLLPDVLGILLAGMLMSLFVPKGARGYGRSADLAAYAWVPYLTLQVAGSLVYSALGRGPSPAATQWVTGAALAWAVAVWALALDAARTPAPPSATTGAPPVSPATTEPT